MKSTQSTTPTIEETYESIERRIQTTITILVERGVDNPNMSAAAREFNLPMTRLRARWLGQNSKQTTPPRNRKLNAEQELALCIYLDRLDAIGTAARLPMVNSAANTILRYAHTGSGTDSSTPPPVVCLDWARRFLS